MAEEISRREPSLLSQEDRQQPEVSIQERSDVGDEVRTGEQPQTILPDIQRSLKVYWVQPTLMGTFLILGVITAVSHHLYYYSLHHRKIYHGSKQQWPLRIGAGLSFVTVSLFNIAIGAAYTQYAWVSLKREEFSLSGINHLFSLTSDPSGLFSKELLTRAKSVALLALLSWLLPIGTVIPPATLSVANVVTPLLTRTNVPSIHTNTQRIATEYNESQGSNRYWTPTPWVRQITARAAISSTIGDIPSPAANASYEMSFPGPALKCDYMNQKQEKLLEIYKKATRQAEAFSLSGVISSNRLLVFNAFNPEFLSPSLFSNTTNNTAAIAATGEAGLQFWIQTAEKNIVCVQGFSFFHARLQWTNSNPHHRVTRLNFTSDIIYNNDDQISWPFRISSATFLSLFDLISGSLTISQPSRRTMEQVQTNSSILLTGLRGCDEIARNYWLNKSIPSFFNPSQNITLLLSNSGFFESSPSLCRNKTLLRALEDLSDNITISFMAAEYTSQNVTATNVLLTPSQLLYVYDSTNLILTYCIVGVQALVAVMFGFAALSENGVVHSLQFSAVMDSTRSPELSSITKDCGLGSMPVDKQAERTMLKFGPLKTTKEGDSHQVGFVVVGNEARQEKGSEVMD